MAGDVDMGLLPDSQFKERSRSIQSTLLEEEFSLVKEQCCKENIKLVIRVQLLVIVKGM